MFLKVIRVFFFVLEPVWNEFSKVFRSLTGSERNYKVPSVFLLYGMVIFRGMAQRNSERFSFHATDGILMKWIKKFPLFRVPRKNILGKWQRQGNFLEKISSPLFLVHNSAFGEGLRVHGLLSISLFFRFKLPALLAKNQTRSLPWGGRHVNHLATPHLKKTEGYVPKSNGKVFL